MSFWVLCLMKRNYYILTSNDLTSFIIYSKNHVKCRGNSARHDNWTDSVSQCSITSRGITRRSTTRIGAAIRTTTRATT